MISNCLVTVILPCFNVENYVTKAIKSVFEQTYTNIEVIAINDGSTDRTSTILHQFVDPRIQICDTENFGYGHAVQVGINKANGKYLIILEPDDWWDNYYLEPLVKEAVGSCADAVFYNSYFEVRNGFKDRLINQYFHGRFKGVYTITERERKQRLASGATGICFGLYKTEFLRAAKIKMDVKARAYEDVSFIAQIFAYAQSISLIPGTGYYYRRDVPTQSVSNPKRFESILKIVDNFLADAKLTKERGPAICGFLVKHLVTYYWKSRQSGLMDLNGVILSKITEIARGYEICTTKSVANFIRGKCINIKSISEIDDSPNYKNIPNLNTIFKDISLSEFLSFAKWKLSNLLQNNASFTVIASDIFALYNTPGYQNINIFRDFWINIAKNNDYINILNTNENFATQLIVSNRLFGNIQNISAYVAYNDKLRDGCLSNICTRNCSELLTLNSTGARIKLLNRMCVDNVREFCKYISNKRIEVVGNSPCELNKEKGREIDNHDIIIRCNNFSTQDEFVSDYGSKSSVWAVTPTLESIKARDEIGNFDYIITPLANNVIPEFRMKYYENLDMAGLKIVLFPIDQILFDVDMRIVSLGLLVLKYLVKMARNSTIDIYGFSLTDQLSGIRHYFSGDPSAGKLLKFHDWMKEALILNKMIEKKEINHA